MTKKQRSVSLCDHFKRSYGDRCKRKEDIVQGSDKKEDALSILSDCRKEKFGIAAHVRHRYFAQGKLFTSAGRIVYGKDAAAVCCVRNMEEILSKVIVM